MQMYHTIKIIRYMDKIHIRYISGISISHILISKIHCHEVESSLQTVEEMTQPEVIGYITCFIRKSKYYVYGIWVYNALGIWKGYYRVKKSLVSYVKPWTEARNNKYMKYHSKLTYQLQLWIVSRKVDYHAGGKWFIHGTKRRKENQLLSLKHPCWLSLV